MWRKRQSAAAQGGLSATRTDWRRQAPAWTAAALAGLLGVDAAHNLWEVGRAGSLFGPRRSSSVTPPPGPRVGVRPPDPQQLIAGHLFGAPPERPSLGGDADGAADTAPALSLTGIIATKDPRTGYAILGEPGNNPHLYRAGAPLGFRPGVRLSLVFPDRVVLDFDGRLETLRLPHYDLPVAGPQPVRVATTAADESAAAAPDNPAVVLASAVTPAQTAFSLLDAERREVDGRMDGMVLHPAKRYQRQYGLRDGDTLTAVNGVTLTDPDALTKALESAGKSLSLTFVRDGVPLSRTLQVND